MRRPGTVTGAGEPKRHDGLGERRGEVLAVLWSVARGHEPATLRASALIALGRMGTDADAVGAIRLLRDRNQPAEVLEAAALALGIVAQLEDETVRTSVHEHLEFFVSRRGYLPRRAHAFALVAAGIRARRDARLSFRLVRLGLVGARTSDEAAALGFGCGLSGNPVLLPELERAVKRGEFAQKRLNDVGRSHLVQALALLDEPAAIKTLTAVARSRRARIHTRRAAVLSLGRLLRRGVLDPDRSGATARLLATLFENDKDALLRGFAALGAGGAPEPHGVDAFRRAIDRSGNAVLKPYAALALGLAARVKPKTSAPIRRFLSDELDKTKEPELASALCIALGLGLAQEALDGLLNRVESRRVHRTVRGAAAQAVGLIGHDNPRVGQVLSKALESGPTEIAGDVALSLGLLGRRSAARTLVGLLDRMNSTLDRGRVILALGHLGHADAVPPLLDLLENPKKRTLTREFAAVALGLMGDSRDEDVLFGIDGDFNYLATTTATYELVRLY